MPESLTRRVTRLLRQALALALAVVVLGCGDLRGENASPTDPPAVIDGDSKHALVDFRYAVLSRADGSVIAKNRRAPLQLAGVVRSECDLVVYARGYDVLRVPLDRVDSGPLALVRARRFSTLGVDASFKHATGAYMAVKTTVPYAHHRSVITDNERRALQPGSVTVPAPTGARVRVYPRTGGDGYAVPMVVNLAPKTSAPVRFVPARRLRLDHSGVAGAFPEFSVVMADLLTKPQMDPREVDGVVSLLAHGSVLRGDEEGDWLTPLAAVGYHVFLTFGNSRGGAYRFVSDSAQRIVVPASADRMVLRGVPRLSGVIAEPGSTIAPGRLHFDVISRLQRDNLSAHFARVGEDGSLDTTRIPRAPWVTVWSRQRGLSFIPVREDGQLLSGDLEACSLVLRVPPSNRLRSATIDIWPTLGGTGRVKTGLFSPIWSKPVIDGQTSFFGLPAGTYIARLSWKDADADRETGARTLLQFVRVKRAQTVAVMQPD